MKKKFNRFMIVAVRQSLVAAGVLTVLAGALWYRLSDLVWGFSLPELTARAAANSGEAILRNPLFLPHKLLQYGLLKLGLEGPLWMRLPSTLFGALIILVFYRILRTWYSARVAMFCSMLLLTSAWFLHYARLGTPEILYAALIGVLWAGIRLKGNSPRTSTILLGCAVVLGCLYVPGLPWFIIPVVLWQQKAILREINQLPKKLIVATYFGLLVGIAPLLYAFVRNPVLIREWLAIPAKLTLATLLQNVEHLPFWLVWRGPVDPVYWLGQVPLLDTFSVVMFVMGVFVYAHHLVLDRVRTIAAVLIGGALIAIVNGPWVMIMIAPVIYIVVASGVALMLQQWFTVFPRNPLARWVGICLVGLVVGMASAYNISHYFIAWPKATPTRQAFQHKG